MGVVLMLMMASVGAGSRPAPAGAAGADRALEAQATAQGVRMRYTVPAYLVVEEFMDAGGPVAESLVDSTGQALSFASFPYPSETVVTVNGAASVLGGVPVPPLYPLYAEADYPVTEKSEVTDPTGSYLLRAAAGPGTADGLATARSGGDSPVASVAAQTAAVLDEEATTTVTAQTTATGIAVGDTLRIASVRSRSVTTLGSADQAPVPITEMVVEGARVGDQAVTIGPDGVHAVPGATTGSQPSQEDPGGALEQAGIRVRTVSAAPVEGGAAADLLEITSVHTLPVAGEPQGTLVWRFGGATTSIRIGAEDPAETSGGGEATPVAAPSAMPVKEPIDESGPAAYRYRSGIGQGAVEAASHPSARPEPGMVEPGSVRSEGALASSSRDPGGSGRSWPPLVAWTGLGCIALWARRTRGLRGR